MSHEADRLRAITAAKMGSHHDVQYIYVPKEHWDFLEGLIAALETTPTIAARRWRAHIAQSVAAGGWCPECGTQGRHVAGCLIAPTEST